MAKKRDVIIAVIITFAVVMVFGFFGFMFLGIMMSDDMTFSGLGGNIGVVELFGVINEQSGRLFLEDLEGWTEDNSIEAIVLHLNSPGGGVAISQEIYDAVLRAREEKPIVVSMAGVAASGAYYISCAADKVIANPGTITGSIGVIFSFHTYEELMGKIGVGTETVKSGEMKDVGSYAHDMSKKEELMLKSVVMDSYEQFVDVIVEGRDLEIEEVRGLADGSIFTGSQALNYGLVDSLGGFHEAVQIAADMAELEGEPKTVYPFHRKETSIFDLLGSFSAELKHSISSLKKNPELMFLMQ